jgi:hypothetical protein
LFFVAGGYAAADHLYNVSQFDCMFEGRYCDEKTPVHVSILPWDDLNFADIIPLRIAD